MIETSLVSIQVVLQTNLEAIASRVTVCITGFYIYTRVVNKVVSLTRKEASLINKNVHA